MVLRSARFARARSSAIRKYYHIDTDEIPRFFKWRTFGIQWRYNFYLSHVKISQLSWLLQSQPIGNYHHSIARIYRFHSQISCLEKQDGIFKSTTKFPHEYFRRLAKRKDRWKVCSNDSKVDNLIKTEEKRNTVYNINFVKQFPTEHCERRSTEEIPAVELNNYQSKFMNSLLVVKQRHKFQENVKIIDNAFMQKPVFQCSCIKYPIISQA